MPGRRGGAPTKAIEVRGAVRQSRAPHLPFLIGRDIDARGNDLTAPFIDAPANTFIERMAADTYHPIQTAQTGDYDPLIQGIRIDHIQAVGRNHDRNATKPT